MSTALTLRPSGAVAAPKSSAPSAAQTEAAIDAAICRLNRDSALLTALPYSDRPIDPASRQSIESLIAQELTANESSRVSETERVLQHFADLRTNSSDPASVVFDLSAEQRFHDELASTAPMFSRELRLLDSGIPSDPVPAHHVIPLTSNMSDSACAAARDSARVALTHAKHEAVTLDLMKRYGPHQWRAYNAVLNGMLQRIEHECSQIQSDTKQLNRQRRIEQQAAHQQLDNVEKEFTNVASDNNETEFANYLQQQMQKQR